MQFRIYFFRDRFVISLTHMGAGLNSWTWRMENPNY